MPRFPLKFAALHNPLFMAGSNLGDKLNPRNRAGLTLQYDTDMRGLIVSYQHTGTFVPDANVSSADFSNMGDLGLESTQEQPRQTAFQPQRGAIIPPTAPPVSPPMANPAHRAPRAMAPQVNMPQRISAQVSSPVQDAVNGVKMTSPPKYLPHTQMETQRANAVALSGSIQPGAAAPTRSDLEAAGKLAPSTQYADAPTVPKSRARKSKAAVATE